MFAKGAVLAALLGLSALVSACGTPAPAPSPETQELDRVYQVGCRPVDMPEDATPYCGGSI
jgi:hypothetical protein